MPTGTGDSIHGCDGPMTPHYSYACLIALLSALPACSSNDAKTDANTDSNSASSNTGKTETSPPNGDGGSIALNECGLDTGFAGDEFCILPPPPEQGFQLHIGPTDYDNPDGVYVLQPGEELTTDFPAVSGNDNDVFFYYRQYRLRPAAHHAIITVEDGSSFLGRRIGTANISQDSPPGGVIAPENVGVGSPLAANSTLNVSFHAINTMDTPQLRELWVNFWYRDPAEVTQPAEQLFKIGSMTFSVAPHTEQVLGPYTCNAANEGRLLWLYGHRHANNVRFTVWRERGAQEDLIYDADNWEEPLLLDYSSIVTNPAADIANGIEGGWSGPLDLMPGDQLKWQCDVINNNDTALQFTNQTYLGEMCIIDGELVGTTCDGL